MHIYTTTGLRTVLTTTQTCFFHRMQAVLQYNVLILILMKVIIFNIYITKNIKLDYLSVLFYFHGQKHFFYIVVHFEGKQTNTDTQKDQNIYTRNL
jgi:hypothetical protein